MTASEKIVDRAERIALLALALVNAARSQNWPTVHDCEVRMGELMESLGDNMDSSLTMEDLGFVNDHRRMADEATLTAGITLK